MTENEYAPVDPRKETQEKPEWEYTQPEEGICDVYSNFLDVNWTRYDIRIRFMRILPGAGISERGASWVAEDQAAVTLAWPEAKFLRDMLTDLVARYEKINGELKVPELPPNP